MPAITANILYNLVQCPHRIWLDHFGDFDKKEAVSSFVELLWESGNLFEKNVIKNLKVPFTDLSELRGDEKLKATDEALNQGDSLIYSGRIAADDLVGEPDLLRKTSRGYLAGDIKSGAGETGEDDDHRKPKKHYAVQLALYTDILERKRISGGRFPFIWDVHGEEVVYALDEPRGKRTPETLWEFYEKSLDTARKILGREQQTLPANAAVCKMCPWRQVCLTELKATRDLSLIPELGRSKRDVLISKIPDIRTLARSELTPFLRGSKTVFSGIGPGTLKKYQVRAKLQVQPKAQPFLKEQVEFPETETEIFFDIETDPMRDICYLHGFVERRHRDNSTEKFVPALAKSPIPEQEKTAFSEAMDYLSANPNAVIYYYSSYERTNYRKLREKYPDVATEAEIEALFTPPRAIDLYRIVRKQTEWPTFDFSIKTLAKFLGFSWRDTEPSGAASIEWYHRWVETGDDAIRQRILEYNEDDCVAMRVLLDGLRKLSLRNDNARG